jgi:hypothetical protein
MTEPTNVNFVIITNAYAFLGNSNCVMYFSELAFGANKTVFYCDETHFKNVDMAENLSLALGFPVIKTGLLLWKRKLDKYNLSNSKATVYTEGLFSPFQNYTYRYLKPKISKLVCYSATMPYAFQDI